MRRLLIGYANNTRGVSLCDNLNKSVTGCKLQHPSIMFNVHYTITADQNVCACQSQMLVVISDICWNNRIQRKIEFMFQSKHSHLAEQATHIHNPSLAFDTRPKETYLFCFSGIVFVCACEGAAAAAVAATASKSEHSESIIRMERRSARAQQYMYICSLFLCLHESTCTNKNNAGKRNVSVP